MKLFFLAISCGVVSMTSVSWADDLSPADREELLVRLGNLQDKASAQADSKFRVAIDAYTGAMGSTERAFSFYMKCVEKADFTDKKLKGQVFRDWKRREDARLKSIGFRKALLHQLRWLVLTLQAASSSANINNLAPRAADIVDAVVNDADDLAGFQDVLHQGATSTAFARAYDLSYVRVDDWPESPVALGEIYDKILLPRHRRAKNVAAIKAGWTKRIKQELALRESWTSRDRSKIGMADALRSPEFERFLEEQVPELQWQMETDLFRHGDESGAALRMLSHLDRFVGHRSARRWAEQFQVLLSTPKIAAPDEDDEELLPLNLKPRAPKPNASANPPQGSTNPPQGSTNPPQGSTNPPQGSTNPPQGSTNPPQGVEPLP